MLNMQEHPQVRDPTVPRACTPVQTQMFPMSVGTLEYLNGVKAYVATPADGHNSSNAILLITDGFGHGLNNNFVRLLSEIAKAVPDGLYSS